MNPIFRDSFEFVPARFSCGFGAIYNATKHLGYNYYEHQLYYLGAGMDFDYIRSIQNLGYENLHKTYLNLKKFCNIHYEKSNISLEKILCSLAIGKLVLVYVDDKALEHQKLTVAIYPFHVLLIYGYEEKTKSFYVADLYIIDSIGNQHIFVGKIIASKIIDNIIDCLIIGENCFQQKDITKNIASNIALFVNKKDTAVFQYTNQLLIDIESEKINPDQIAVAMVSSKWNVFLPFYECAIKTCDDYNNNEIKKSFENLFSQVQHTLLLIARYAYKEQSLKMREHIIELKEEWTKSILLLDMMGRMLMLETNGKS